MFECTLKCFLIVSFHIYSEILLYILLIPDWFKSSHEPVVCQQTKVATMLDTAQPTLYLP